MVNEDPLDSPPLPSPTEPAAAAPSEPAAAVTPKQREGKTAPRFVAPVPPMPPPTTPAPMAAPQQRRDFFSDAMREVLSPFAGIIERKIQPLLTAIEAIPDQAERFTKMNPTVALDQIHTRLTNALPGKVPTPPPTPPPARGNPRMDRPLRPPGAMEPGEFETVCSRCGKCVEACPAEAIKLDPNGLIGEGFPYIVAEDQPCVVSEDLACMKSCPTGALKLVDRLDIDLGTAKVDHALCLRDRGENCTLCLDVCPVMAEDPALCALVVSPLTGKVIVRKNICIGCGLCEHRCPTEPRAIVVIPHARPSDPLIA